MSPEAADLPATEQADLDAIISGAIDQAEAPDQQTEPETGTRNRDQHGRFAPKETEASETPKGPIEPASTAEATPTAEPAQQQFEPHPRWNEAYKAQFNALPSPEAKQFVLGLQHENEAAFTRKSQELAEFRRAADPWMTAVNPFAQYLAELAPGLGTTPPELVKQVLAAEYTLRTGTPVQKYQQFAQLAQSYGVDLSSLSRGEVAQPDPLISQLRQQVSELQQRQQSFETQNQEEQQRSLSVHISAFANAKTEQGQPRYPHFDRVRAPMAQLLATGDAQTLEEAYSKAIAPINEAVAAELRTRQQAAEKEQSAAVEKAKRAAPVRTSGSQPGKTTGGGDLDSIIAGAIDRAGIG